MFLDLPLGKWTIKTLAIAKWQWLSRNQAPASSPERNRKTKNKMNVKKVKRIRIKKWILLPLQQQPKWKEKSETSPSCQKAVCKMHSLNRIPSRFPSKTKWTDEGAGPRTSFISTRRGPAWKSSIWNYECRPSETKKIPNGSDSESNCLHSKIDWRSASTRKSLRRSTSSRRISLWALYRS